MAAEKRPNLKTAAVVALLLIGVLAAAAIAAFIAIAIAAVYAFASHPSTGPEFMEAWSGALSTLWVNMPYMVIQNILFIALAAGFTLAIARERSPWKELGLWPIKGALKYFLAGAASGLVIILVTSALLVFTGAVSFEATGIARYGFPTTAASFAAVLAGTAFIAFGEEMVFRGFLQNYLAKKYGIAVGLIATSAIFMLLHVTNDPRLMPVLGIFLSSLLLGTVYAMTGSLYTSIGLHYLWDFMLIEVLEFGKPILSMGAYPLLMFSMPGDIVVAGFNLGRLDDGITLVVISAFLLGLYAYRGRSRHNGGRRDDHAGSD